jgi:hypothetical protein
VKTQCPYCKHELILEFVKLKRCAVCGASKPVQDYAPQSMNSDGKSAWCPECEADHLAKCQAAQGGE